MAETVAIIGAGPLGRWLAMAAARAGYCVRLEDVMPANLHHAQEWLRRELGPGARNAGPSTTVAAANFAQDDNVVGVVAFVSTIEDAVREADLVIDCVPDELESKLEILWLLDRMAPPRTVLATPTTRLSIADLANCTYRPGQVVAIVAESKTLTGAGGGEVPLRTMSRTTKETVALVERFWRRLGFLPVVEADTAELLR